MWELLTSAAFGLAGAGLFAGAELGFTLWGGPEISERARKLAFLRFLLAMLAGPLFSATTAPMIVQLWPVANLYASALVSGIIINPVIKQVTTPGFIRRMLALFLRGIANQIDGDKDAA